MELSVDVVGKWLSEHLDELFERYPEIKRKIIQKLKQELKDELATKEDIVKIMDELRKLREDFNRQQEQIRAIMDELKKLREDFNRQQEQINELRSDVDNLKTSFESFKRMMMNQFMQLNFKLDGLGARWGLYSESAFRNGIKKILEDHFKATVIKWEYFDEEGIVYGHPSQIDIDILITNGQHILIEIKACVDKSDVAEFYRKSKLYEKVAKKKAKLMMITPYVRKRAYKLAHEFGIEIVTKLPESEE